MTDWTFGDEVVAACRIELPWVSESFTRLFVIPLGARGYVSAAGDDVIHVEFGQPDDIPAEFLPWTKEIRRLSPLELLAECAE